MSDLTTAPTSVSGGSAPFVGGSEFNSSESARVTDNTTAGSSVTDALGNGPLAESVKDQHAKTQADFANLAASKTTPTTPAATGQELTPYHSFFSSLLTWENPRASGIAFATIVLSIFAVRYLDVLRYIFKAIWVTLGVTVLAEGSGKLLFSTGLASHFRPRKYYTLHKDTLEALLGDVNDLLNFFVIESQRILFAENLAATTAAFLGAFFSYYLIKIVPLWGLALLGTSVAFLGPLVYKTNQELIDEHIAKASEIINQQTAQIREVAGHHAAKASETTKVYVGEYSNKAQELIQNARGRQKIPGVNGASSPSSPAKSAPKYQEADFPPAPTGEFKSEAAAPTTQAEVTPLPETTEPTASEKEPLLA